MRWPWQRTEKQERQDQKIVDHAAEQQVRVQEAQGILEQVREDSDGELKRAHAILDDVKSSERVLAMYAQAEEERRGGHA